MKREELDIGAHVSFVRVRVTSKGHINCKELVGEVYRLDGPTPDHIGVRAGKRSYYVEYAQVELPETKRGMLSFLKAAHRSARFGCGVGRPGQYETEFVAYSLAQLLNAIRPDAQLPEHVIGFRIKMPAFGEVKKPYPKTGSTFVRG